MTRHFCILQRIFIAIAVTIHKNKNRLILDIDPITLELVHWKCSSGNVQNNSTSCLTMQKHKKHYKETVLVTITDTRTCFLHLPWSWMVNDCIRCALIHVLNYDENLCPVANILRIVLTAVVHHTLEINRDQNLDRWNVTM